MTQFKRCSPAEEEALQFISKRNFHQTLLLPATDSHERLRVTYAITSNFDDNELPAILYFGPLFPSRYHAVGFDHIASVTGVRMICVDR